MVFSSPVFLLAFLPVTVIVNLLVKEKYSNFCLLLASLFFYAWGEPLLVFLMMASIAVNWWMGRIIGRGGGAVSRLALILGVVWNLSLLGYYKYAGFLVSIINRVFNAGLEVPSIALPIGISFFTFQAISYIADVYRKEVEPGESLVNTALYISFFPQLIAGPIVKYKDINRQIEKRVVSSEKFSLGFKRFIYGLAKKVLISNVLGLCVDTVYAVPVDDLVSLPLWIAALSYTFQIYYDFSGYSDMAIGLGKMFGFDIPENFNYPYLSRSVTEFWRRWHISLGAWFRDYLYIPLGGNRKGEIRTYINLVIVFFLTGLWHGAAFSFILWGLYHGFFQIVERLGLKKLLDKSLILSRIYCFLIVNFGWVLFRCGDTLLSLRYIKRMLTPWDYSASALPLWEFLNSKTLFVAVCAVVGMGFLNVLIPKKLQDQWKDSVPEALYCTVLLVLCISALAGNTYNPFIYFQF